jgi:hypothetical protein
LALERDYAVEAMSEKHLDDETRLHYEAELRKHYGDVIVPLNRVCNAIFEWLRVIHEEHLETEDDGSRDEALHAIAKAVDLIGGSTLSVSIMARKSNLLARLIYANQKVRTKKCPEHKGHWSGYYSISEGPCECCDGLDITGWLPE